MRPTLPVVCGLLIVSVAFGVSPARLATAQRVIVGPVTPPPPEKLPVSPDTTPIPASFSRYSVTVIGTGTSPGGFSDTGYVTGTVTTAENKRHAFLWKDGKLTDLGTLAFDESMGTGVNDLGEVTGISTAIAGHVPDGTPMEGRHPFLYKDGKMTDISVPGLEGIANEWTAYDINNRGMVVGQMTGQGGRSPAASWQRGRLTSLGTIGGYSATAYACSDRGVIVGRTTVAGFNEERTGEEPAFLYKGGRMIELGTLGGKSSTALDVNNNGDVVGFSSLTPITDHPTHAFVVRRGKMTDLGTFGANSSGNDHSSSSANGINDAGQIVGTDEFPSYGKVYFLYQNGVKIDLQRLVSRESGWSLDPNSGKIRINNRGQILCQGQKAERGSSALLLSPIPAAP